MNEHLIDLSSVIDNVLQDLKASRYVTESSAEIMTFMVQDYLDFAQIKAGKFRKNITKFNICKQVKKIIAIQKLHAE